MVIVEVKHIVAAINVMINVAFACTSESLDGVLLAFLHTACVSILNNRYLLAAVDAPAKHIMPIQVAHTFNRISFVVDFDFEALHGLLDLLTDVSQTNINASSLDARLCGFLNCSDELIILWVKSHCESTVSHKSANVRAVIDLHDVVLEKYSLITKVRCVVSCAVVDAATGWESNASL